MKSEAQLRWQAKRRAAGQCLRCGRRPVVPGMVHCQECRIARTTDQRLRNQKNKHEQKCLSCSQPRPADRAYCDRCSARKAASAAGHGATLEDRVRLFEQQKGGCAICDKMLGEPMSRFAHVDHDHATKRLRGLLCMNCNTGLGNLRDSVALLERAISYLKGGIRA